MNINFVAKSGTSAPPPPGHLPPSSKMYHCTFAPRTFAPQLKFRGEHLHPR